MESKTVESPAILIIDMVKDNFKENGGKNPIPAMARQIVDPINRITGAFRKEGWPVVFATDSFHKDDFIFTGKLRPHSLAGTTGAEVADELERREQDLWLPKPRFSAFFNTDLAGWLRERGVTLCVLGGITTNFCVLATAMDALCLDFKVVLLEDCITAVSEEIHAKTLDLYRRNALYPLLRVAASGDLIAELSK